MTGKVKLYDGSWATLPALLDWALRHTDGCSADSFSVTFRFSPEWAEVLGKAVRFRAEEAGTVRFYGIVDEYETALNGEGLVARVYGRGMAGLLLDNQVGQREYYYARLSDMIRNYVTPYGIGTPEYGDNFWLTAYAVEYGESAWDAFCGFCLWAADIQPRFLPDGTLVISGQRGTKRKLNGSSPVLEAAYTGCRYGVYSTVVAKYISSGYEQRFENRDFQARGGCATYRMTIPRRNRCRAGLSQPSRLLAESQKGERGLKVTVSELFWAQPMDEVQVSLPKLGLQGAFLVTETENSHDVTGTRCVMTMHQI